MTRRICPAARILALHPHVPASNGVRKRKQKRDNPEQRLHMTVADYLRLALKPPTIWTTIGHGGGGKTRGALLKAMGVQPGWPDILVLHTRKVVGLELKAPDGEPSPAQRQMQIEFRRAGWEYEFCWSINHVEGHLREIGIPVCATAGLRGRDE